MDHPDLADYPVRLEIPVQWGEMDAYGHVNNTVFFRYFESARIAYLGACGFLGTYDEDRVGAILHSTSCRFKRSLEHPDTVIAAARVTEVAEDRFTMWYAILSTSQQAVVATGIGVVVAFDYTKRQKTRLPDVVLGGIERVEGRAASDLTG